MKQRITIKDIDIPKNNRINEELKWVCDSLGFMAGRDTEDTSFKIIKELLEQFKSNEIVSTEMIAKSLNLEPPRINHHLRNLMESGIIFREKRKVALTGGSLSRAIEEMKRDSDNMFEKILEISKKIDKEFFE